MNTVSVSKARSLKVLKKLAVSLGISGVSIVNSSDIIVNTKLARLCKGRGGSTGCGNYGMSLSCPPNVEGPFGFKRWQQSSDHTIVIRIDVPNTILFSNERLEVMRLLHETVANVEQKATKVGYLKSRSFAGGSCKEIFCHDYPECSALSGAKCRNLGVARPSMSGFGIDVYKLMDTAGWHDVIVNKPSSYGFKHEQQDTTWVVGIVVLIAK